MFEWLINVFRSNQNGQLKLPMYEEFRMFTEQLEGKLPGLDIEIKVLEKKFEKAKEQHDTHDKKKKELENKYKTEKQSLDWFNKEVNFLDEIKEEIIERAQNITTDFKKTYCANVSRKLESLKKDIRKSPHPHKRIIDDLKREIDYLEIQVSDLNGDKSRIKSNISSLQKTLKKYSNSIKLRKEFELKKLLPLIERCHELNDQLKNCSHEDHDEINTEYSESIEELNGLIDNFEDNQKLEPEESDNATIDDPEDGDDEDFDAGGGGELVDADNWPDRGLLRELGYKVGEQGESEENRHDILNFVFDCSDLPNVNDENYMDSWGEARSEKRLKKLVNSLSGFIRLRENHPDDNTLAISQWSDDLNYIKEEIYHANRFSFPWPDY